MSLGEGRLRILLELGDVAPERAASFDESYPSTDEQEFSRRLVALAADLYRVSSVLVVKVAGSEQSDFGRRQVDLLRAELERLGVSDEHVEIRVVEGG